MEDYEKILEEAYSKIKPVESKIGRFEIPAIEGLIEGNKTIINNLKPIASYLRRDINHLAKCLIKELAAAGSMKGDRLILTRKIPGKQISEKLKQYVDEFVVCKQCGKPDTELQKQNRLAIIHCLACGAKHPVRTKF